MTDQTTPQGLERWTIDTYRQRVVAGPRSKAPLYRVDVMPVSEHEAAISLAEQERDRQVGELKARVRLGFDLHETAVTRADKAESDLATERDRAETYKEFWEQARNERGTLQAENESLERLAKVRGSDAIEAQGELDTLQAHVSGVADQFDRLAEKCVMQAEHWKKEHPEYPQWQAGEWGAEEAFKEAASLLRKGQGGEPTKLDPHSTQIESECEPPVQAEPADRLNRCNGTKELIRDQGNVPCPGCVDCQGGEERCELCEGDEQVAKNFGIDSPGRPEIVPCPRCQPAPSTEAGSGEAACERCEGSGRIPWGGGETFKPVQTACPACLGTGQPVSEDSGAGGEAACERCGGMGGGPMPSTVGAEHVELSVPCPDCQPIPPEVDRTAVPEYSITRCKVHRVELETRPHDHAICPQCGPDFSASNIEHVVVAARADLPWEPGH